MSKMAKRGSFTQYYTKNLNTGLCECEVIVNGTRCGKAIVIDNIAKHIKTHFPDLREQKNAANRNTQSYQRKKEKNKQECEEKSLSVQLKKRRALQLEPLHPIEFNSQTDGNLPIDLSGCKQDYATLMSAPALHQYTKRVVYFLMMLPSQALINVHDYLRRVWQTDTEIPVYIGKNNTAGPAFYHSKVDDTVSKFCSENGLTAVHVHDISFRDDKPLQELTECWFQCFMSYVRKKKGYVSFKMINEKIEEKAAREHQMTEEDFGSAKSAGERGLHLFCIPGCQLTHNNGNLRFYPCLHMNQKPQVLDQKNENEPKPSNSKQGTLDKFIHQNLK